MFTDVSNRPYSFGLDDITLSQKVDLYYRASIDLATAIIISTPNTKHSTIYEKAMMNSRAYSESCDDRFKQFEEVRKYITEKKTDISEIIKIDDNLIEPQLAVYWLSAYSNFFESQPILFLDNGDSLLDATSHHDVLYNYTKILADSVCDKKYSDKSPPKIILALRDENVKISHPASRRTRRPMTISLAYIPYGSEDEYDSSYLPLNLENMGDIINLRLDFCRSIIKNNQDYEEILNAFDDFSFLIKKLWARYLDDSEKKFRTWERIDLVNICNGSIRVGLDMARFTTITVLKELYLKNLNVGAIKNPNFKTEMKSRIINWFFKDTAGQNLKEYIKEEFVRVKNQELRCCTHRILLTFLYNKLLKNKNPYGAKIKYFDLFKKIGHLFGINEDHFKETLYFLYHPGDYFRELISIEQIQPLDKYSDISSNASIYINQRGVVLISRIMQTNDYWSRLTDEKSTIISKSIFALSTYHALKVFQSICETVIDLSNKHIQNWYSMVSHPEGIPVHPDAVPFDWFKNDFTIGNNFYLERVSNSHIFSLFRYANYYLHNVERSEDESIVRDIISMLNSYQEKEDYNDYVEKKRKLKDIIDYLKESLARLKKQELNYFVDFIYKIVNNYLNTMDKMEKIKRLKKNEILDKVRK